MAMERIGYWIVHLAENDNTATSVEINSGVLIPAGKTFSYELILRHPMINYLAAHRVGACSRAHLRVPTPLMHRRKEVLCEYREAAERL